MVLIGNLKKISNLAVPVNEEVEQNSWQVLLGVLKLLPEVEGTLGELAPIGEIEGGGALRSGCSRCARVGVRNPPWRRCRWSTSRRSFR